MYRLPTWNSRLARSILSSRAGVDRAGQAVLGVVGDRQRVVEVLRLDHGQHRSEDLFLREACHRVDIGDHGGLDEVAVARRALAAGDQAAFLLADLDVIEDRLHGAFVDHRAHARVVFGHRRSRSSPTRAFSFSRNAS